MAFASVAALLDTLRQASLLEPSQLAELDRQAGQFRDPRALAGELVRRGWLTPYQVNQLFQGRAATLVLGPFVLLERLGEGGMGQVFKARQRKLGRTVALKVIRKERLDSPDAVRRFRREIQAAAQLSHPNIVLAIDADEHEGTHFFAMEHVEGADLAKHVKQHGPLPVAQACDCIRQAAQGLQHAHERGLVHRDIKPHNLLLTTQGVVKVLDMGLARLNAQNDDEYASSTLTQEGAVMGTPDYIAPEQALDSRTADIRADLYSLGCTFFFLLTGRVPFPGGSVMEKLLKHQGQAVPSLLDARRDVPPPIADVVHRLMAKSPAERYQTPAELLTALAAALTPGVHTPAPAVASAPPIAIPADTFADLRPDTVPTGDNLRQATERKRLLLLSAAGGGVLLALVLLLVLFFRGGAKDRVGPDSTQPAIAEASSAETAEREWRALQARGEATGVDRGKLRAELLTFRRAHPGTRQAIEAGAWLMRLPSPLDSLTVMPLSPEQKLAGQPKELLAVLGDHRSWVGISHTEWAGYSPDGRWIACNTGAGTIRLLDPSSLVVKAELKLEDDLLQSFDFRRDGKQIATAGVQHVALWDLGDGQPRQTRRLKNFPARPGVPAFSPDGKLLAVPCGTQPPTVRLWDLSGGEPKESAVLPGHTDGICKPVFSPDGKTLVTGSLDHTIRVWDLSGLEPRTRAVLKNHTYWVVSVALSPDGTLLASSGQHDRTLRLWDMTAAEPKEVFVVDPGDAANNVAFSPDGKRLASGLWDRTWRLWDVSDRQLKPLYTVSDHVNIGTNVSFAPDGRSLVTSCNDGTVHLWDLTGGAPEQRRIGPGHIQAISGLAFASDDRTLASMSADHSVRLWDIQGTALHERAVLPVKAGPVCGAFAPEGSTLLTSDGGNKLVFWDAAAGKERRSSPGHDAPVQAAAYSPDGKVLVTAGADNALKFWDVETGDVKRVERLDQGIRAVAFHPDGRSVAVACGNGSVQIWHARQSQLRATCKGPEENVAAVAFSPDGKVVASGGKDGRVRLWDAATGRERSSLPGHDKDVRSVAFTLDGKWLLSAGADGQVIVRDSTSGKEQQRLRVPLPIHTAALTGDGRHLAVGHIDGTVYLLRLGAVPK
jgi:WD40 repeat protein/serine/threonine protein kinase